MARFGKERITALGLLIIASSVVAALTGSSVGQFWISLTLLGLGWKLGFIGATAMVTDCHNDAERSHAQGANDSIVFGTVAVASFSSGVLLSLAGWAVLNWLVLPAVTVILVPLLWRSFLPTRI